MVGLGVPGNSLNWWHLGILSYVFHVPDAIVKSQWAKEWELQTPLLAGWRLWMGIPEIHSCTCYGVSFLIYFQLGVVFLAFCCFWLSWYVTCFFSHLTSLSRKRSREILRSARPIVGRLQSQSLRCGTFPLGESNMLPIFRGEVLNFGGPLVAYGTLIFQFPKKYVEPGVLGAWFQIFRELEDQVCIILTWNPNGAPAVLIGNFGLLLGWVTFKNRGHLGSRKIY